MKIFNIFLSQKDISKGIKLNEDGIPDREFTVNDIEGTSAIGQKADVIVFMVKAGKERKIFLNPIKVRQNQFEDL